MSLTVRDLQLGHPGQPPLLAKAGFTLETGARLAIFGANGAGKTTLGRALAGHLQPLAGDILWQGRPWSDYSRAERASTVQFVGQRPWLQISGRAFTLREEIAFGPENLGLPRTEIAARTDTAMSLLGLTHLADRDVRHLSGGETQRLVLAGALAMRPRLLVLDEPMTDLNAQTRDGLRRHLNALPWQMATIFLDMAPQAWMRGLVQDGLALRDGGLFPASLAPPALPPALPHRYGFGASAIRIEGLGFAHPGAKPLFRDISLTPPMGSVTALLGPNGAGKSTFLRLLAGLARPDAGRIMVAGLDPARANARTLAGSIGVTFQASDRYVVQPRVLDEVAQAMRLQGTGRTRARFRAGQILAWLGLERLATTHPMDMHAGARRLIAVAAAVAHGPGVLMLDESQRGLDHAHLVKLEALIALEAARGAAVLVATHDMDFVTRNASHVITLQNGGMRVMPAADYLADPGANPPPDDSPDAHGDQLPHPAPQIEGERNARFGV